MMLIYCYVNSSDWLVMQEIRFIFSSLEPDKYAVISYDSIHRRFVYFSWYTVVKCIKSIFLLKVILLYIMIKSIFDVAKKKENKSCIG